MKTFEEWWKDHDFAPDVTSVGFDETHYNDARGEERPFRWADITEWAKTSSRETWNACAAEYERAERVHLENLRKALVKVFDLEKELAKEREVVDLYASNNWNSARSKDGPIFYAEEKGGQRARERQAERSGKWDPETLAWAKERFPEDFPEK